MTFSRKRLGAVCDPVLAGLLYSLVILTPFFKAATSILPVLMGLVFILKKCLIPDSGPFKAPDLFVFYAFMAFSLLSVVNSEPYTAKSLSFFFGRWLKNALIFLIAQDILIKYSRIKKVVWCCLGAGAVLSLDGFFQKYWGYDAFFQHPLVDVGRGLSGITATFQHYNSFGIYLAVFLLFSIALLISLHSGDPVRATCLPASILFGSCLYWTYSRGSWVAVVIGLGAMMLLSRRFKTMVLVLTVFLGCLFLSPEGWDRFLFIFQTGGDQGRFVYWKVGWNLIRQHPFLGIGLGTFGQRFVAAAPTHGLMYAHNSFLQIWAEAGILTLAAYVVFLLWILGQSARALWRNGEAYLLALFCGFLGFMIHSFVDNDLYSMQLSVLFWVLLGTLRRSGIIAQEKPAPSSKRL
ncbi:MAG: O-antigen ligase family protein [Candidatus Omnitrophica bacterium]|nr:O-antigen ligase family protein [Candidatus Omnitrophota bacterium]